MFALTYFGMQALIANFAIVHLVEGFAAISFAVLLRNVDKQRLNQAVIGFCVIITAWMLAGVIAFALASHAALAMSIVRICLLRGESAPLADGKQRGLFIGLGVVGILIELAVAATAVCLVQPLQMRLADKIQCSLLLCLCTPL